MTFSPQKSNLDKDDFGNYRHVSHLSFLFKLTERVFKLRLADYLSTNNLLNSFQSAYIKHYSTVTTFLSISWCIYHQSYESLICSTFSGNIISHRYSYSPHLVIVSYFSFFATSFYFHGANVNVNVK